MNELTTLFQDNLVGVFKNDAVTTSLRVAEVFGKRHDHLLRIIKDAESTAPNFGGSKQPFPKS